ncbi:MAG: DUF2911 domain-containing protein [Acidobacteriota bacterium]|nr:DUF2911 domain-containing protein [Acidobacteriota bacterium]
MKKLNLIALFVLILSIDAVAQLNFPRESQRQEITQTVGDVKVAVVYHRPDVKDREIWGNLVPYGEVWRTGANDNTTFEVSSDVRINGQTLPKGKYGLHTIPGKDEWTIIFNKVNNEWGSFKYDQKQDALRVSVKPDKEDFLETMTIDFQNVKTTSAEVVIAWEKVKVPFTVDVGDVIGRTLADIRTQLASAKADDYKTPAQAANWVLNGKMVANYEEALKWINASIGAKPMFQNLSTKARLLGGLNRKDEAVTIAERAIKLGKAATPAADTTDLEKMVAEWKATK